ncbi:MAG: universal stress protein [Caldimonas sp.]
MRPDREREATAYRHAGFFAGKEVVVAGIRHDMEVRTGRVSNEFVDCSSSAKLDVLVPGAKNRSGIADLLLGSVTPRVMSLFRPAQEAAKTSLGLSSTRVVSGLDLSRVDF